MFTFTKVLLKKKWMIRNSTEKRPHLYFNKGRLPGRILCVTFNKFTTAFEVSDYVKISKKQRSNVVDVQIKDIFQYNYIGICIAQKKDTYFVNANYIIRNTFDKVPYELTVNLYSPVIESIYVFQLIEKLVYITHSKYFYLRKKPLPMSTIFFDYVTDMYDNEAVDEKEVSIQEVEKLYYI